VDFYRFRAELLPPIMQQQRTTTTTTSNTLTTTTCRIYRKAKQTPSCGSKKAFTATKKQKPTKNRKSWNRRKEEKFEWRVINSRLKLYFVNSTKKTLKREKEKIYLNRTR